MLTLNTCIFFIALPYVFSQTIEIENNTTFNATNDFIIKAHEPINKLFPCVHELLQNIIPSHADVTVNFYKDEDAQLRDLVFDHVIKPLKFSFILTKRNISTWQGYYMETYADPRLKIKSEYYVMFAGYTQHIEDMLLRRYQEQSWSRTAYFIFVIIEETCERLPCMSDFALSVAKLFVENFILVVRVVKRRLDAVEYMTIGDLNNCFESVRLYPIGRCSVQFHHAHVRKTNEQMHQNITFQPIDYAYFGKCQLQIKENLRIYPYLYERNSRLDGLTYNFLSTIITKMNLNISDKIGVHRWCDWPGETAFQWGAPLQHNKYGVYEPNYLSCLWFQPIGSFYPWNVLDFMMQNDLLMIVTRKYGTVPAWHIFKDIFPLGEWALVIGAFIIVFTTWLALVLFSNLPFKRGVCSGIALNLFSAMLNIPVDLRTRALSIRLIFLCWLVYSMNFTVLFQTSYTTMVSHPKLVKQLTTLEDVVNAHVPIDAEISSFDIVRSFVNEIKPNGTTVRKNSGRNFRQDNTFFTQKGGGAYVSYVFHIVNLFDRGFLSEENTSRPLVNTGRSLFSTYVSLALPIKQHIYTREFNRIIHAMHAYGFSQKIQFDHLRNYFLMRDYVETLDDKIDVGLEDLICPVLIVLVMSLMSFVVLLVEVYVANRAKR